jgi:spermidine synthase
MTARKEDVISVTVVEKSEKVIELFKKYILPRFECRDKIRIVCADAFEYAQNSMPAEEYDYAFVDTWRDASDGLPMYERMKKLERLSPKTEFSYWIQSYILSRKRAQKYEILREKVDTGADDAPKTYADFIKELYE